MRFFKDIQNNVLIIGKGGNSGETISEQEYNLISDEINFKKGVIKQFINGEVTLEEVPQEWQEEAMRIAQKRAAAEEEREANEADYQNALAKFGVANEA